LAHPPRHFKAIHRGHSNVEKHNLGPILGSLPQGVFAIIGDPDIVPQLREQRSHSVRGFRAVIDD